MDHKESWVLKNWCFWTVVLEKTLESPLDFKEIQPVHPKGNQSWIFTERTDAEVPISLATWCEGLTHLKRTWCRERLRAGGEGDDRGWDGWMASPTQWTWVWINSGTWWWTGRPGTLWSMGSQSVRHDWATELTDCTGSSLLCRLFISCGEWGLLYSYHVWVSHCGGFSCCKAWALGSQASVVVDPGL